MAMDKPEERGVRVDNDANAFVPENCDIRPLRDHVLIEPLPWEPSKIIAVVADIKPVRGRVLAVGPGRYQLKYDGPKGKRTKSWLGNHFQRTSVKVGDIVEMGGLELKGYMFPSFTWGNKKVVMIREGDIAAVVE
jgi:co-chaperonin GroES (HSP10)